MAKIAEREVGEGKVNAGEREEVKMNTATMEELHQRIEIITESGCWIWTGWLSAQGYPYVKQKRKSNRAHRVFYEFYKGPIPDGLVLDHLCRVRCCVNPNHLEAVTSKENILRGTGTPAVNSKKTHCKRGHEFIGENIKKIPLGKCCRQCDKDRKNAWYQRNIIRERAKQMARDAKKRKAQL